MDNNKKLTPEEVLVNYPCFHSIENSELGEVVHAMEQYAAQEGAAERSTIDELSMQINELRQEVSENKLAIERQTDMILGISELNSALNNEIEEKGALLKEAYELFIRVIDNARTPEGLADDINMFQNKISTGKEAGEDGK